MRERQRRPGAFVAVFGALLQANFAGRDDGNLRHGEDAVGEDEEEDDDELGADAPILPFDSRLGRQAAESLLRAARPAKTAVHEVPANTDTSGPYSQVIQC